MIKTTKLTNGLNIVTQSSGDSQSVAVAIFVGSGARSEEYERNGGMAHFLEHLLFKGTRKRPEANAIAEEIDAVGGMNNAYTDVERIAFYIKVPKQHFELALDILADMVTEPLLEDAAIERERGVILEELNVHHDEPAQHVEGLMPWLLWPQDNMATDVLGRAEVVASLEPEAMRRYFREHYLSGNMVVSVAGNVTHEQVVAASQRLLDAREAGQPDRPARVSGGLATERLKLDARDSKQTHLVLAARAAARFSPDEYPLRLLQTILGAGMSSRLFRSVREEKALAYTVDAFYNGYSDAGSLEIYAGVSPEKTLAAVEAILHELELISAEPVGERELAKAQEKAKGSLQLAMEDNLNQADFMGSQMVNFGQVRKLEDIIKGYDAVSAEDILVAAQKYLQRDSLRLALVGPVEGEQTEKLIKILEKK